MVERRKLEVMAVKRQKTKRKISLSGKKDENYKCDTRNDMDFNHAGINQNPLQL